MIAVGCLGFLLFLGNYWLLDLDRESLAPYVAYTVTLGLGYLCLMLAGILAGRLWSVRLLDDPFNRTNESFPQETRCIYNEHSLIDKSENGNRFRRPFQNAKCRENGFYISCAEY